MTETMSEQRQTIIRNDLRAIRKAAEDLEAAIALAQGHGLYAAVSAFDLGRFTDARTTARRTAIRAHRALGEEN